MRHPREANSDAAPGEGCSPFYALGRGFLFSETYWNRTFCSFGRCGVVVVQHEARARHVGL
ncbi:hypothetical protein LIA77_06664 [Sarocladium implicatum]|nr:hypothetical protein LIA77_06664 [Sarocladium implicatum]